MHAYSNVAILESLRPPILANIKTEACVVLTAKEVISKAVKNIQQYIFAYSKYGQILY